jgi:hypothetical protein
VRKRLSNKRIRDHFAWNTAVYRQQTYTDSQTGESYCLKHMSSFTTPIKYEFKELNNPKEKRKGVLDVLVVFDPHCYTSAKTPDDKRDTLVTDHYNDGSYQERAFDLERYKYSHALVKIITNLSYKTCRESQVPGKAIRLEDRDKKNPLAGVYVVMKLRPRDKKLTLYVETAHYRTNEPYDAKLKKVEEKYMLILGRLLRDKWPDVLPVDAKTPL